jgi:predicted Zn-dependent protease
MPPKRSTNPKKKSRGQKAKKAVLSSKELFEAAQAALDYDDFDQARNCFQLCLKQAPDNLEYIDAYGSFLAEVGDVEEAVTVLKRSIQLSPDIGYEKYMYLGAPAVHVPCRHCAMRACCIPP